MSKPSITQDQIEQLRSNLEQEIIEIEEELKWLQGDGEKIQSNHGIQGFRIRRNGVQEI